MNYIFILTTTLFILFCTPLKHHIISSPVFGSQRKFFHDNSCTYLQFFSSGKCFFHLLFFVLLPIFFCHFQVLQFSLGVHPCQGLNSWSRLIVTLCVHFGFVVRHFENGMVGVMAGERLTHTAHVQRALSFIGNRK